MSTEDIQIPGAPDEFETGQDPFPQGQPGFTTEPTTPPDPIYGAVEDYCTPEVCAVVETTTTYETLDTNSDGVIDGFAIDSNGDGVQDLAVFRTPDGYWITADTDADGFSDGDSFLTEEQMQFVMPELWEVLQPIGVENETVPEPIPDPVPAPDLEVAPDWEEAPAPNVDENGQLGGDPEDWAAVWFRQSYNNSCVPSSIAQIFNLYTGNAINEEWFYRRAEELGMWSPIGNTGILGLNPSDAQTLLAESGIPATVATLESSGMSESDYWTNLDAEIESGTGVMVMVDSRESIGQNPDGDAVSGTDHAVLVTDIDEDRGIVTLNDPGRPEGAQMEISIADFHGAWQDSGFAMLMCDQSASEFQAAQGAAAAATSAGQGDPAFAAPSAQPVELPRDAQPDNAAAPTDLTNLINGNARGAFDGIDQIQPPMGQEIVNAISSHGWILLPVTFAVGAASNRLFTKKAPGA